MNLFTTLVLLASSLLFASSSPSPSSSSPSSSLSSSNVQRFDFSLPLPVSVLSVEDESLLKSEGFFRRKLMADYTLVNSILSQIDLEFDTSGVAPFTTEVAGVTIEADIGDTTFFSNLAVGEVFITGKFVDSGSSEKERYVVNLEVVGLEFIATVTIDAECIAGFLCFTLNLGQGLATVTSDAGSNSRINLTQIVESPDFDLFPPVDAFDLDVPCSEQIFIDGITFGVQNIGTALGFSIDGIVAGLLNGDQKDAALDPIKDALCAELKNITQLINAFILDNPLTAIPGLQGTPSESLENALDKENALVLPPDADVVNIQDNLISNLLFPEWTDANATLALGSETPIFQTLFGLFGVDITGKNPLFALVDLLVGTNLTAVDSASEEGIDLLELAAAFLTEGGTVGELLPLLFFAFNLPDFGNFSIAITGASLTVGPFDETIFVEALGDQTLLLPLDLGNFSLTLDVDLNASVDTNALLNQTIVFSLEESFSAELSILEFETVFAVLLALDLNQLFSVQLGPLLGDIFNCILSAFITFPAVTAAVFNFERIELLISNFQDALGVLVGDALNAIVPIYSGLISRGAAALVQDLLTNLDIPIPSCPVLTLSPNLTLPYDFPSSPLQSVSNLIDEGVVNSLLDSFLVVNASSGSDTLQLLPSPIAVNLALGSTQLDLGVSGLGVNLGPDLSLAFDRFELLNASDLSIYSPQGLVTNVSMQDALALEIGLQIDLTDTAAGTTLSNALLLNISLSSIDVVLELFAALSIFDVEATELRDLINLNCWTAELDPYGGIKTFNLVLAGLSIGVECTACQTTDLQALADVLSQPGPSAELGTLLSDGLDGLVSGLTEAYTPQNFNATVATAQETCAAGSSATVFETKPDLQASYVFIGAFAAAITVAGVASYRKLALYSDDRKMQKSDKDVDLERIPLYRHPSVPRWAQVGIPFVGFVNLVMFMLGHIQIVIATDLVAQVAGITLALENFGELSVINSTLDLFEAGAFLLAFLIGAFSIVWPYLKLLLVGLCWFTSKLSFRRRGKVLVVLDQLGKWSLVELFFVAFLFVVLKVEVTSPTVSFLPDNLYVVALVVRPQFSLYTFTTALLLSLLVSNIVVIFHERIEHEVTDKAFHCQDKLSLAEYYIPVHTRTGGVYEIKPTKLAIYILVVVLIAGAGLLIYAGFLDVLTITFIGLAGRLMEISGVSNDVSYSIFSFIESSFSGADAGELYFAVVFVLTVAVLPVLEVMSLIVICLKRYTLTDARNMLEKNQILCAWCATEVFVLAVAIATLEIKAVAENFVEDECAFLVPLMENILFPLGLVSVADVEASCLGLLASISDGIYPVFISLVLINAGHAVVIQIFKASIHHRKLKEYKLDEHGEAAPAGFHAMCVNIGLAELKTHSATDTEAQKQTRTTVNPFYQGEETMT